MKTLKLAILMAFGLSIPYGAMSSNHSNTPNHTMLIHENSQHSVMNRIQIQDAGSEKAADKGFSGTQLAAKKHGSGSDKQVTKGAKKQFKKATKKQVRQGLGTGEMDRDRLMDQDRTKALDQDKIGDNNRIFEQDPAMEQTIAPEPPMLN